LRGNEGVGGKFDAHSPPWKVNISRELIEESLRTIDAAMQAKP
jgi:hypothetical protein